MSYPTAYRITNRGFELVTDFRNRPKGAFNETVVGQFIAQLGEEGWEMVGAGNEAAGVHCLYFKCPKPWIRQAKRALCAKI